MKIVSDSPGDTAKIGEKIGKMLVGGEKICLFGELGVGKTCLAQGIVRGAGVTEDQYPRSPTFSIINKYQGRFPVYHLDLYRLDSMDDIFEVGVEELLLGEETMIVEWSEKLDYLTLNNKIDIKIVSSNEDRREIYSDFFNKTHAE